MRSTLVFVQVLRGFKYARARLVIMHAYNKHRVRVSEHVVRICSAYLKFYTEVQREADKPDYEDR